MKGVQKPLARILTNAQSIIKYNNHRRLRDLESERSSAIANSLVCVAKRTLFLHRQRLTSDLRTAHTDGRKYAPINKRDIVLFLRAPARRRTGAEECFHASRAEMFPNNFYSKLIGSNLKPPRRRIAVGGGAAIAAATTSRAHVAIEREVIIARAAPGPSRPAARPPGRGAHRLITVAEPYVRFGRRERFHETRPAPASMPPL
ncbi:hypothetical protein EVAR_48225_1 [Eumeta japonica]|uniref:Uncharacterized protein n=1 Tax=Eumeta variegata TaxID=151549 RepID=A0A4C1YDJ9_EUMVA|nr:hypothetical protein EVAR_48225_1 [Eumeta japonica]